MEFQKLYLIDIAKVLASI